MIKKVKNSTLALAIIFLSLKVEAQSVRVETLGFDDYLRRSQLMGEVDSTVSFTIRPLSASLFNEKNNRSFYLDSTNTVHNKILFKNLWPTKNNLGKFYLLPASVDFQINSHHPYGFNDGPMIPAKGIQTLLSGGFFVEYGPVSLQFKPEIVLAANSSFETLDRKHYDIIFSRYYDFYNNIDAPSRFGESGYSELFLGQSSLRLNHKGFSAGLSTENLWWGPGRKNSLLMSNNAPGFIHATINTIEPLKSPIGSFEAQLIGGRLLGTKYGVLEPEKDVFGNSLYLPKRDEPRYITGLALTWQPKWVKGLFLGLTKSEQLYRSDINKLSDILPFHSNVAKVEADQAINANTRDSHSSYFMRWLWQEERAELYFEFGRNNNMSDSRGLFLSPDRSRAYILGLRKIFPFNKSKGENFLVNIEVTQMQETHIEDVREGKSWYVHPYVRHGYTHLGQVLGAGIGPGGNMQSLDVNWFKGLKQLGFQIERYVHNNDFYYFTFEDSKDFRRHWTDLSLGVFGEWNYDKFIFNTTLTGIKSLNYQWYLLQETGQPYMTKGKDIINLHVKAGLSYHF